MSVHKWISYDYFQTETRISFCPMFRNSRREKKQLLYARHTLTHTYVYINDILFWNHSFCNGTERHCANCESYDNVWFLLCADTLQQYMTNKIQLSREQQQQQLWRRHKKKRANVCECDAHKHPPYSHTHTARVQIATSAHTRTHLHMLMPSNEYFQIIRTYSSFIPTLIQNPVVTYSTFSVLWWLPCDYI